jgi:TolB-like protein
MQRTSGNMPDARQGESGVAESSGSDQVNGAKPAAPEPSLHPIPAGAVFISYASQDAGIASSLVEALERQGVACWIAPRDVRPGDFYADAIVQAINACPVLVLVLSKSAIDSSHVLREVERASAKKRPVIAFRIDAAPLPPGLEYFLSASQWIDVSGGTSELGFPKLLESLRGRFASMPKPEFEPRLAMRPPSKKGLSRSVIALLVVATAALVYFVTDKFWLGKHVTAQQRTPAATSAVSDKSIAVLPFTDMSEKKDQEYFADGMAEEVLDLLAKIPGVRVIGRTSSFQFKGKSEDLRTIGNTLGAAYVVEGSVRQSANRLRVTAQLIGTSDGSHLWSESYDEDVGDVLKVQDQIATGIVRALQVTVGADDLQSHPVLRSAEAYDLYQRGRHAMDRFDQTGFEAAAGNFQQALDIDPSSIRAAEWLAEAHESIAEWGFVPPGEGYERARQSVRRALALDPKSAIAHALMCTIHTIYDWDWTAAADESKVALALEPNNPLVLGEAAALQKALGRLDDAARMLNEAFALDPLHAGYREQLGNIRYHSGRLAEGEAELRKTLALSPTYISGHFYLGQILLAQGKLEPALLEMQQEAPDGGRDTGLSVAYYAMGRKAESDATLARLTKERANDAAFEIAQVHAYRGEIDQAFTWLERAYGQKDVELYWIKTDPWLKNLEPDARYKAFLQKMRLPE